MEEPKQPLIHWRKFSVKSFLAGFFGILVIGAFILPSDGGLRETFRRKACSNNIVKLGQALAEYAKDNGGFLPQGEVFDAMKTLRRLDYLSPASLRGLSSKPTRSADDVKLEPQMFPFIYFGAGLNLKEPSPKQPLLCDQPGRHKNFGHVLFSDGHIEGFKGGDWFEQHVKPFLKKQDDAAKDAKAAVQREAGASTM